MSLPVGNVTSDVMSAWGWVLGCLGLCTVLLTGCNPTPIPVVSPPSGLETLWVVDPDVLSPAEETFVLTLQGLVADGSSAIWIKDVGMNALILADLKKEGTNIREAGSVWDLLDEFREAVAGSVLYDLGTDSINVATSLCGPLRAVAVDTSLLEKAEAAGLAVLADVRGMDEVEAFDTYGEMFASSGEAGLLGAVMVEQAESKNAHLRDFAVSHVSLSPSMALTPTTICESRMPWART